MVSNIQAYKCPNDTNGIGADRDYDHEQYAAPYHYLG
jgi:hypothetical protein